MNIGDITVEQIMSEYYYVIIKKNPKFGFDVSLVSDEVDEDVVGEGVHPVAMESFASLCRRFLKGYERCQAVGTPEEL